MFDFKELEAFVWVVRLGSFRKVAARPVQPTLRGREFFEHAERLLAGRGSLTWPNRDSTIPRSTAPAH